MSNKRIIGLIVLVFFLSTCVKKIGNKTVSFQNEILPIFISNCAGSGCHNSKDKEEGYDFTNYEGIMKGVVPGKPLFSEVYTNISGNKPSMPKAPYSQLKAKEVELIKLWINMGAPNNKIIKICDTSNVTFQKSIQPILQTWCISCHNNTNVSAGINLSTYEGVMSANANNRLMGSIKHLNGFIKMPQNGSQLSECEISSIEKWLRNGALNN